MRKLAILFICLNFLDYLTTKIALLYGAWEFNRLADYYIQRDMLGVYKLFMMALFAMVVWYIYAKRSGKRARIYVIIANVALGIVVVWNTIVVIMQVIKI